MYFVRILQDRHFDHAVVVDANNRAIIDSEEKCALALEEDLLERCGGVLIYKLRVHEVLKF